jgi:hypothetical protein
MPSPYTPTARLVAGDPRIPDGDPANAAIDRELADARRYLRGSVWAQLVWSGRAQVSGTAGAPVIALGAIEAVTLCDGDGITTGTWRPYNHNLTGTATAIGAGAIEGGGSLASSSHYYVYAYNDGTTTVAFQVSSTRPTTSGATTIAQAWKRGQSANYRYLFSFATDSSGNPLPGVLAAGRWTYRSSACGGADVVLTHGRASTWTAVDLSALVPPHARVVRLRCSVTRASGDNAVGLELRTPGDATAIEVCLAPNVSSSETRATATIELIVPAQSIEYQISGAPANVDPTGATIAVLGWE